MKFYELVLISLNGKPFKCSCGANVFLKYDNTYICNCCKKEYEGK